MFLERDDCPALPAPSYTRKYDRVGGSSKTFLENEWLRFCENENALSVSVLVLRKVNNKYGHRQTVSRAANTSSTSS